MFLGPSGREPATYQSESLTPIPQFKTWDRRYNMRAFMPVIPVISIA